MSRRVRFPMKIRKIMSLLFLTAWWVTGPVSLVTYAQEIKCRAPGSESARAIAARIDTKTLASIVKATGSFETKVQRIRNVSPKGANFDIIAFRLCEAAKNKLITREFYQKYLLTSLRPVGSIAEKWNLSGDVYVKGKRAERLANAEVELGFEPPRMTSTALDGTFSFAMREEDMGKAVVVRVRKAGYRIFVSRVVLKPNMGSLGVAMSPREDTFVFIGKVTNSEGTRPLVGARVRLGTDPPSDTRTKSDGRFRFDVDRESLERFVSLRVEQSGYRPYVQDIRLTEKTKLVTVMLARTTFRVRGSIRNKETQEPLEGVRITLRTEPITRASTGSDGKFNLRVPMKYDGEFAALRAEKPGFKTYTADVELVKDGGDPVEVEMFLVQ